MRNKSNLCLKSVQACCLGSLVLALSNLLALGAGLPKINIPKVPDPVRTVDRGLATITEGDAKVAHKIAEHTVAHAIKRFGIADLVTDRDIARAHEATYEFLKWKMGNPTTIAGQFATAGYGHFEKAYSDEAAASLLGFDLPREKGGHSQFFLPPEFVKAQLTIKKAAIPMAAEAIQDAYGVPKFVSEVVLQMYVEEEAKVLNRVGINMPRHYDFPNGLVQLTIDLRRNPTATRAKLQQVIDGKTHSVKLPASVSARLAQPR